MQKVNRASVASVIPECSYRVSIGFPIKLVPECFYLVTFGNDKAKWIPAIQEEFIGDCGNDDPIFLLKCISVEHQLPKSLTQVLLD